MNLKTRSYLGQNPMSAHGMLPSGGSLNQPQIMTQTNTATNSLAKMKTIGDLKSNHNN